MSEKSHKRLIIRRLSLGLIALALMVPALVLNISAVMAKSTPQPATGSRAIIHGHLVPALKHLKPMHVTRSNQQLQLSVALNLRNRDQLNQLLQEQNNPLSPLYHQYLTPQQFADLFGPTQDTVNQVVSYLRSQGMHVGTVSSNHTLINASGSVATVEKAFNLSISDYSYDGRSVYAPTSEPSVPASLSGMIVNISGLDNVAHYRSLNRVLPAVGNGPNGGYTPSDLRTAYDMNSLISSADGTGQTVAIFELDGYEASDINTYLSQYSLGSAKYSNVLVDGATNTAGSGAIEVELDMEVVSAIAPGASQKIYIGPNSESGVNDTYNKIVTDDVAKVTSTSWGECEANSGNSELSTLDNIFAQASAQGQAIFAAAGDAGAYDCGDTNLGVDSPADDPYVVGVGGTNLSVSGSGTYSSESVWSNSSDTSRGPEGVGGGGGYSSFFSKPSYQTGPGVDSNSMRHVPDVSADADPATGYAVYCTVSSAGCSSGSAGWIVVGGTSAAAPLWAGVATDTNEYLTSQGKATLGNAHTSLYALFNTAQTFTAFHDVTSGNNLHYNATSGYDVASGIGSPDVWNLARDAANVGGGTPTPTPTPTNTPTPTPTPTNTPTPTPTPPPSGNLVVNGGFESGTSPWQESSANGYELVDPTNPHAGSNSAYLCGYNSCNDQIWQSIKLPSSFTTATFSYWTYIDTNETTSSTCYDHFYAKLRTSSGTTIAAVQSQCNVNAHGWTKYTFTVTSQLSSYKGQTIQVYFQGTTDSSLPTDFFVDDVSLTVS